MRMNVKLFTLQMSLPKTEELCRNSVAKYNSECCIPRFTEDESGIEKFAFNKTASKQVQLYHPHLQSHLLAQEDAFKNSDVVVYHTLQGLLLRSGLAGSSPWNPHRWHFTFTTTPPSVQASAIQPHLGQLVRKPVRNITIIVQLKDITLGA